jgi:hypothetical protein
MGFARINDERRFDTAPLALTGALESRTRYKSFKEDRRQIAEASVPSERCPAKLKFVGD